MATTASLIIIINGVDGYRTGIGLARKTIRHKLKKNCHYEKFVEFLNGSDGFVVWFFQIWAWGFRSILSEQDQR